MFPQDDLPPNLFEISTIPWSGFSRFELQIEGAAEHLAPIVTFGRYSEDSGRTMMPVSIQVSHAVADGFHAARLIREFEELVSDPDWLG